MKKVSKLLQELSKTQKKGIAWLVDPDKRIDLDQFAWVKESGLDLILVGGSSLGVVELEQTISVIKQISGDIPVCIFPGSHLQLSSSADAILFMALISGRNPEFLISQQVQAAQEVQRLGLEVLSTGYILVNDGELLSVHAVSQTMPLSNKDPQFVGATALAGKYLGMRFFYLDAGSGAMSPVSPEVIQTVKSAVKRPVLVGGGLKRVGDVKAAFDAGADLVVLGNAIEKDPGFLSEVMDFKQCYNHSLNVN